MTFKNSFKNEVNQSMEANMRNGTTAPRKTWKYVKSEVKHLLYNFCETTSMHGFRHITASRLSFIEKLIWALICCTAAIFCLALMIFSYQSTQERLTLIQLVDQDSSLYTLDFPAVTICNVNKVYKPNADKLSKKLLRAGFNDNEIKRFFHSLPQLLRPNIFTKLKESDSIIFNKMLYSLTGDLKRFMQEIMQPCSKLLKSCTWMGRSYNCSNVFITVDSFEGHCCGFNYHVAHTYADSNYSPQCMKFYKNDYFNTKHQCKNESVCPGRNEVLKTPGSGSDVGLIVELNVEPDLYLGRIRKFVGATVIIHNSKDFPETEILTATVQPRHEVNLVLSGQVNEGLDEIKTLTKAERKCIFEEELNYDYSYQSCVSGCKVKRILAACNCIPYYYPVNCVNLSGLCDFKDINCIQKYQYQITSLYEEITLDNGKTLESCDCPELCNKIYYDLIIDKIDLSNSQNPAEELRSNNMSVVNIFFQEYGYDKYEISLFLSWNDLIANLGGLIGLCLGGSFISLMEPIVYFILTPLRRAHHRQMRRDKEEAKKRAEEASKEQFNEWQMNKNNIFTVRDNFTMPENVKNSNSENLNLFRTHFM